VSFTPRAPLRDAWGESAAGAEERDPERACRLLAAQGGDLQAAGGIDGPCKGAIHEEPFHPCKEPHW
jgi:hypothetical protein